jgi:hypothetical protein
MSEALVQQEQDITLPNEVVIRFIPLASGQLILAERKRGNPSTADIMTAMGNAGVVSGHLDENIKALAGEASTGEVPVAAARMVHLPLETNSELFNLPLLDEIINTESMGAVNQVDVTYPVKEGQPLLSIEGPPKTVIEAPDGTIVVIKEHEEYSPEVYAGENIVFDSDGKTLLSSIEGYAGRDIYGVVSVYPVERMRVIGEIHARVANQNAIIVDLDIDTGSRVKIPSTLIVEGNYLGAELDVGGSVQINLDGRVPDSYHESSIVSGMSVRVQSLQNTVVKAGSNVIVTQDLSDCKVECLDTFVARRIMKSQITVGCRMVVEEIGEAIQIHLGGEVNLGSDYAKRHGTFLEHSRRLADIEEKLAESMFNWKKTQQKVIDLVKVMQDKSFPPDQRPKAQKVLSQLSDDMSNQLRHFSDDLGNFKSTSQQVIQERIELDYYRDLMRSTCDPFVLVLGEIAAGTKIKGPANEIALKEAKTGIRFDIDPYSKLITESPLESNS